MIILGLLIGSLAVQPFLYAALLIEMAALAAVPLLAPQGKAPGRAVIKFLIYQTLGMPCILLAGWLLAGVETSPGDLALTIQATVMLSLGFAFLLAVFPLNDWIPGLMQESQPYLAGFLVWLLPNIILVFGLSFLDGYAWLRASPEIVGGMRNLGLIMLVSSGILSALEQKLGRMMGYAAIAETGFVFLATSLAVVNGTDAIFPFFIPRGIGMALWALALAVVDQSGTEMDLASLRGIGRTQPWAGFGLVLAALSTAGLPLLAGFPPRIDVWDGLAGVSPVSAVWFLGGLTGLMIGAVRQLAVLADARGEEPTVPQETLTQRVMLGSGMLALILMGLFPRAATFVVDRLPLMFEHLVR
jgi:formate hydrogenlyase subunit 3/multisubunit Na+/H+ antiporter MnhD subunit